MNVYDSIKEITLSKKIGLFTSQYVTNFEDNELGFSFETEIPIDGLERGWIGDIKYTLAGADRCTNDKVETTREIKDALLVRVSTEKYYDIVEWKYEFLKS